MWAGRVSAVSGSITALPFDLAEAVVPDDDDLHVQRVFSASREFAQQHCEPAVTDEGDDLSVRKGQRRSHRIGQSHAIVAKFPDIAL
jgi:hypothetical protein